MHEYEVAHCPSHQQDDRGGGYCNRRDQDDRAAVRAQSGELRDSLDALGIDAYGQQHRSP